MDWLIWIGGWYLGVGIVPKITSTNGLFDIILTIIAWTMVWIWICWKFI